MLDKCGQELQDIGLYIQETASDIRSVHKKLLEQQAKDKAHKHKVRFQPIKPITEVIPIDDDCIVIPKPVDNDCNRFHDKSDPVILKIEAPDCISVEEDQATLDEINMPMGLLKPHK